MYPVRNGVIALDDKNKRWCWQTPETTYSAALYGFIANSPVWQFTSRSPAAAQSALQRELSAGIPAALRFKFGLRGKPRLLPEMYVTYKSKCIDSEGRGLQCNKMSHSCVRKVVSFGRWPKKQAWRALSRCWESVLKHTTLSLECWQLKHSVPTVLSRIRIVQSRICQFSFDPHVCCRCGGSKSAWEQGVWDAG
eukprot:3997190-Lingulodinium_polyedra.AAC.1